MTKGYILRYLVTLHFLIKFLFNVNENCVYICGQCSYKSIEKNNQVDQCLHQLE